MSSQHIDLTQLLDTFQFFDTNKDGAISFDEFRAVCQKLNLAIDTTKLKDIFQNHDNISFDEFCRVINEYDRHTNDAYFNETFQAFDKNSDGYISLKEIKQTMKELGERLTDKQAKQMIKAADINHDGKLSKDEFRTLFNQLTQYTNSAPSSSPSNSYDEPNSQ